MKEHKLKNPFNSMCDFSCDISFELNFLPSFLTVPVSNNKISQIVDEIKEKISIHIVLVSLFYVNINSQKNKLRTRFVEL